jgi:hypothetical protein
MKRYKWIHRYVNSTGGQQMKLKLSIPVLLVGIFLSLFFIGCGTVANQFTPMGEYEAPQLPKSELATIKVDTDGGWIQRYNLIVFRVDGKLALREKIDASEVVSIDEEILVAPGKHEMSLLVVYESFHGDTPGDHQIQSRFSADVEAGSTYLLKGEFGGDFSFEGKLIDINGDKVVSKSKHFGQFEGSLK